MRSIIVRALLALVPLVLAACANAPLASSRQVIVVTSPDWDSARASLRRYERESVDASWKPVGAPVDVNLGRAGLAWGQGVATDVEGNELRKHEGDGRSPAGAFALGTAFGYADASDPVVRALSYPYLYSNDSVQCIEDSKSKYYNSIRDRATTPDADWNDTDKMHRTDDLYKWGVFVKHNASPATPGGGSCIFLHGWRGAGSPTAGCTAMDLAQLEGVVRWLKPDANPMLVQLPEPVYARLKGPWALP
jgi:D-alanyl-D-alanine dipeptidase